MSDFVLTDEARGDLFELWAFVAEDNPLAADRLEADLIKACQLLASQPGVGHRRTDLSTNPSIRFHAVRVWYLLVYELDSHPLRIIRILHGARDVRGELTEE